MRHALRTLLDRHEAPPRGVDVVIAEDAFLRELNRAHRGIDEATDVLTFPAPDFPGAPLGEVAVSIEFARRQAEARGVRVEDEVAMLAVHGGLHLLGYDDADEPDRAEMVRLMNEAMAAAGLPTDELWASLPHGEEGV